MTTEELIQQVTKKDHQLGIAMHELAKDRRVLQDARLRLRVGESVDMVMARLRTEGVGL